MTSRIDRFFDAAAASSDMDGDDLADAIWLASRLARSLAPERGLWFDPTAEADAADWEAPVTRETPGPWSDVDAGDDSASATPGAEGDEEVEIHSPARGFGAGDKPFRVPAAPALPGKLALARTLLPLRRRVPSRTRLAVDEAETVRRVASGDAWVPVMRPVPERWLELTLVIDRSASMAVWGETAEEMRQMLHWVGCFRSVSVLTFDADPATPSPAHHLGRARGGPGVGRRGAAGLRDAQVVWVLTDCVSRSWWNGRAVGTLADQFPGAMISALLVLPEPMWPRTSIGAGHAVRLKRHTGTMRNRSLVATLPDPWPGDPLPPGFRLPVLALEPEGLALLAAAVAGDRCEWLTGVIVPPGGDVPAPPATMPAHDRVDRFRQTASPTALRLAGLLSVSPAVSLQVMRRIRAAMLPHAGLVHEAEVLLGGLLRVAPAVAEWDAGSTDDVYYEFYEGVDQELARAVPVPDWLVVMDRVSRHVEERLGTSLSSFRAVLRDPTSDHKDSPPASRAFLSLAASRLKRLGGAFARWAERNGKERRGRRTPRQSLPGGGSGENPTKSAGTPSDGAPPDERAVLEDTVVGVWPKPDGPNRLPAAPAANEEIVQPGAPESAPQDAFLLSQPWDPVNTSLTRPLLPPPPEHPPVGFVTFLYTDIEGSTKLWEMFPGLDGAMAHAVTAHDHIMLDAVAKAGGYVFRRIGDAYCAAFRMPLDGLRAAVTAQRGLAAGPWQALREAVAGRREEGSVPDNVDGTLRVRMSLHAGAAELRDGDYFGAELNRVARLLSAAHGGQMLLSGVAAAGLPDKDRPLPDVRLDARGSHRLKDLRENIDIFEARFVSDETKSQGIITLDDFRNNLPVQNTAFIGRVREIDRVVRRVSAHHLVTVTGFAGSGKTRLALQVAAELLGGYRKTRTAADPNQKPFEPFRPDDGVWFVDLQAIRDPALVASQVARAVGVREQPGVDLIDTLTNYLRSKTLLLVLDGCERVLAGCAALVRAVLACGGVRVLATSREPLGLSGEAVSRVPSMVVPDPAALPDLLRRGEVDMLARYESIQLFVGTIHLTDPAYRVSDEDMPAIVSICRRVGGLPLGIRVAATLAATLNVQSVADQLDQALDFPDVEGGEAGRGGRLRALIDQSHDRLGVAERTLLRRLGVFAGGWTLRAAEQVCAGDPVHKREVLGLMARLIGKSLVERGPGSGGENSAGRYRFLGVMRDYVEEKLAQSGEAAGLRHRHLEWCVALAREARTYFEGPDQKQWFDRLELDHDNFRAALAWPDREVADGELVLSLASTIQPFWCKRGYVTEGSARLEEALRRFGAGAPPAVRARALAAAGYLAECQCRYDDALSLGEQALVLRLEMGDEMRAAHSRVNLALVEVGRERYGPAREMLGKSLKTFEARADVGGQARVLGNLGHVQWLQGDAAGAMETFRRTRDLAEQAGDRGRAALAVYRIGMAAIDLGDLAMAAAQLNRALEQMHRLGDAWGTMVSLEGLAALAAARKECERAGRLFGAVETLRQRIGTPRPTPEQRRHDRIQTELGAAVAAGCGREAYDAEVDEGRRMSRHTAVAFALGTPSAPGEPP